jgi:nitrate reductase (NAD(P)H)
VNGDVYDGTKFLEGHPGGAQSIISAAATDASEEFLAIRKSDGLFLPRISGADLIVYTAKRPKR